MDLESVRAGIGRMPRDRARDSQRLAAPWPYAELDVAARLASGWRPTAVRDLVLKIHQRCNLACDYCYVYEKADQSWRGRPAVMPDDVRRAAVEKLARHVARHDVPRVRVILHGGEPLLDGAARLGELAAQIRHAIPVAEIGVQTNGLRLDVDMMAVFRAHRIKVGVSVDGTEQDHDRHRRTPSGRGSFAAVSRAIGLLNEPANRECYAGILCTVSPGTDPVATFDQLHAFAPPMIDLLLPHANWSSPPEGRDDCAAWLIAVFDRWYRSDGTVRIRLFEDIIGLLLGGSSGSEQVGLSPSAVLVVESDGAIEQVDALKSAYEGACATGLDIRHDELDAALEDPGIVARQIGIDALSPQCLDCPVHRVCGGGHYAHRYRQGTGFRNPTVYCDEMLALIEHIRTRLVRATAP